MRGLRFILMVMMAGWLTPAGAAVAPEKILHDWYRLVLELVRHTPTYSPPVAARAFAYLGIAAYEAAASGNPALQTLAGQLNELAPFPVREAGQVYDEAIVLQTALAASAREFFANTGPTGQRAMTAMETRLASSAGEGVAYEVAWRSKALGEAIALQVLAYSGADGGGVVENMGFPLAYTLDATPGKWVPTNLIAQQQLPLLPNWGNNRTLAMPDGATCGLPPPPAFSEDKASTFYRQALEVHDIVKALTPEQKAIARFWSDDPMLSPTPPGHWLSIAMQILDRRNADLAMRADTLARLGIVLADAFVGCWNAKYVYNYIRPVTFIRKAIDPKWETLLNTPPFPEYPSGHSTQSAAAAVVLEDIFGKDFAFDDATHSDDGLKPRHFASFAAAAEEAGISRLYGGIHFRSAIEQGLAQGRCIGAYAVALKTRRP